MIVLQLWYVLKKEREVYYDLVPEGREGFTEEVT